VGSFSVKDERTKLSLKKEAEMHILFPTDKDEFLEAVYSVSSWDIAFPTEDIAFRNDRHAADYYLGNSKDKKTWVLASRSFTK
jgi:hypothetical protein